MAITKEKKKEIVEKIQKVAKEAASMVFSDFNGLTAAETLELRRTLLESGVGYVVAKKTLADRALSSAGFAGVAPAFTGQLGIAYGKDPVAPARGVYEFEKKFAGKIKISGGVFEGKFFSKEEMTEIAMIPPIGVLYGKFVNIINSPIQRFVVALNAIAVKNGDSAPGEGQSAS